MEHEIKITEHEIRDSLLRKAEDFCRRNKTSFSAVGTSAVGDSKFLSRVQNNLNFNIKTYQRVVEWLDAQEAKEVAQ